MHDSPILPYLVPGDDETEMLVRWTGPAAAGPLEVLYSEDDGTGALGAEIQRVEPVRLSSAWGSLYAHQFFYEARLTVTNLSPEQLTVLKLINDGDVPSVDEEIEIKTRSSNAVLHQLTQDITTQPVETLEKRGDRIKITKGGHIVGALTTIWMFLSFAAMIIYVNIEEHIYAVSFGGPLLFAAAMIFIAIVLIIAYSTQTKITNYSSRSQDGLLHANYLEGMKLYIKMAEKDRLAFLQSVDGADTSTKGIVKLYEKLLPYAALFGMEKSWSNELAHYYEQEPDLSPVWYAGSMAAFSSMDIHSAIGDISSSIQSSTFSSSGSGFSGGAGGGGGGGGGGGW